MAKLMNQMLATINLYFILWISIVADNYLIKFVSYPRVHTLSYNILSNRIINFKILQRYFEGKQLSCIRNSSRVRLSLIFWSKVESFKRVKLSS